MRESKCQKSNNINNVNISINVQKLKTPFRDNYNCMVYIYRMSFLASKTTTPLMQTAKATQRKISTVAPAGLDRFMKQHENVIPVDASWYMPNVPMNAYTEYMKSRIENAVFFDIEAVKDNSSKYPHMLPTKEVFEQEVRSLGIKNDSDILFYDQQGVFSLCRAAWMFEIFGHDPSKLHILNTYPAYAKNHADPNLVMVVHNLKTIMDRNIAISKSPHPESEYVATFDPSKVITYEQLLKLVQEDKIGTEYTLVDARSTLRFTGEAPEPRKGLSSGHIKNAINLPFTELLTPEKALLSSMSITNILKERGIDESKPIIVMCGTGVTACVVRAAMQLVGFDSSKIAVYDGSWTEWAMRAPKSLIVKDV